MASREAILAALQARWPEAHPIHDDMSWGLHWNGFTVPGGVKVFFNDGHSQYIVEKDGTPTGEPIPRSASHDVFVAAVERALAA
jgi:hypothetical protein